MTTASVEHVLVVRRTGIDVPWTEGRDLWWDETVAKASTEHTPEAFDSEHPLFLLYTSGTTGKPKGIMHTSGGYLTQASYTHYNVFDVKPETDVYWCTADIGWVTGHTYIVYGPLSNGVTQVVYEGTPSLARRAPALPGDRKVRRDNLLHRSDPGAHVHEVGPPDSPPSTTCPACDCWVRSVSRSTPRRGAGTALVFGADKTPDRRHLVADRDRRRDDLAAARRDRLQAGFGDAAAAGHLGQDRRRRRQRAGARHRPR